MGSRFWRRGQQPLSTARPVALLRQGFEASRWSLPRDLSGDEKSQGQGSPAGSKPDLLSVGVRMRALADFSTTVSFLPLWFDAYMRCRMAAAKPPSRHRCSSGRDGGLAAVGQQCSLSGAVDTAFGAWHGGHSLCGALRKWRVEVRIRPYNSATSIDFDSFLLQAPETSNTRMIPKTWLNCCLGLMSGMRYGHTSTSCILGNVCSCAHCCTAANGRDGHTGLVYLVCQTSTNHTFCVDSTLLCQGTDFCCTVASANP